MRFLLILFLALATGIGLTLLAENPGYILITRDPWSLETSLTMFTLGLFLVFAAIYFSIRLVNNLLNAPANLRRWQKQRNKDQATKDTTHGLAAAINGNWANAEKLLNKNPGNSPQFEINLLVSAWLAQQNNDLQKRDDFIAAVSKYNESPDKDIKMATTQVQLNLFKQAGQTEQALASARHLHQETPSNPAAIRSLISLLKDTKQWQELLATLAATNKHHVLPEKELLSLQIFAATSFLLTADTSSDLEKYWKSLSKPTRKQSAVIACYCRNLLRLGQHNEAEEILRTALKEHWSEELIEIYGQLKTADPASPLKYAESWLSEHPTNSALMLCMGRLAIQNKVWGMARSFLEIAVQNGDKEEANLELAWLLESLDEPEAALKTYRSGLEKSLNSGPKGFTVPSTASVEVYDGEDIIPDAVSIEKKESPQGEGNNKDTQAPSLAYSNESK
jgi:HemY protein